MNDPWTNDLMLSAIDVWNRAIERHAGSFPYKQMIAAFDRLAGERRINAWVYDGEPTNIVGRYVLEYADKRFRLLLEPTEEQPGFVWKLSTDYLRSLEQDPEYYIERPERIDWDWLKSRLKIGASS